MMTSCQRSITCCYTCLLWSCSPRRPQSGRNGETTSGWPQEVWSWKLRATRWDTGIMVSDLRARRIAARGRGRSFGIALEGRELRLDVIPSDRGRTPVLNWSIPFIRSYGVLRRRRAPALPSPDSLDSPASRSLPQVRRRHGTRTVHRGVQANRTFPAFLLWRRNDGGPCCGLAPRTGCSCAATGSLASTWMSLAGADRLECLVADDRLTFRGPIAGPLHRESRARWTHPGAGKSVPDPAG